MSVNWSAKRKLPLLLAVVGAVLALAAMVLAIMATTNDKNLNIPVIVVTTVAVCLALLTAFIDYNDLGKIIVAGMYFCGLGLFLSSQLGNLGYAVMGIHDIGNGVQLSFVVGGVLYTAAVILESVAIFTKK